MGTLRGGAWGLFGQGHGGFDFFITRPNFPHECASRFSDDDHDDGSDACMMTMTMTVMTHITTSFRKKGH